MAISNQKTDYLSSFFHLKENPFALSPDPKYLYLGEKHREVLAHLLYGVREDKGFMVVVGEVGTGKTTLCRAFINQLLKDDIEVGLIYNPAMSGLELLQVINREFKLTSDHESKSKLVDTLNEFLLRVNGEGRKVVLIVDEAQDLSPSVLEQLRLISNLETETGKLIQIILVGQPELERILSRKELRQLDQRIVVRGLLGPFNYRETISYIRHRLKIAAVDGNNIVPFSDGACRAVYGYCAGVPRLINVLADRALLVAFAEGKSDINSSIMKKAHRDLKESRYDTGSSALSLRWQTAALFCIFMLALFPLIYRDSIGEYVGNLKRTQPEISGTVSSSVEDRGVRKIIKKKKGHQQNVAAQIFDPLKGLSRDDNWRLVLQSMIELWGVKRDVGPVTKPGELPEGSGLNISRIYGNLTLLRSLNYPAIVELRRPEDTSGVYVILKELVDDNVVLLGRQEERMSIAMFTGLWYGHAFVLWKDFEGLPHVIYPGTSSPAVVWLQRSLKRLKIFEGRENGFYDIVTEEAVIGFQRKNNLFVDGIVGPETRRMLYSLLDAYPKPTLSRTDEYGGEKDR